MAGLLGSAAFAASVQVTFTQLPGTAAVATGVYSADLSGLGLSSIQSITIQDNSAGLGGSPGQFSGFDLDAIILSNTNYTSATAAGTASGLPVFDYSPAGTFFTPGAQRPPTDPKLFGTDASGTNVNNSVATLGLFDGNSDTLAPFGWISLGDNGAITFNLTSAVSTTNLWLYIGEVGNNGEVAAGHISVSDQPSVPAPLPSSFWGGLMLLTAAGFSQVRSVRTFFARRMAAM